MRLRTKKRNRWYILPIILVTLLLLGYGGFEAWRWYSLTHNSSPTISANTVAVSTDTPDETQPTEACENYTVGPKVPRTITIESIGVDGCIERVGVDQNKLVAVPTNIHLAGWYEESVLPGEVGVSLIDGHVLGRYNDAIFAKLGTVTPGAVISIEFGDGSSKKFEIFSLNTYDLEKAQSEFLKQAQGVEKQLTLITCGGDFDRAAQTYNKRVIIQAKLVE